MYIVYVFDNQEYNNRRAGGDSLWIESHKRSEAETYRIPRGSTVRYFVLEPKLTRSVASSNPFHLWNGGCQKPAYYLTTPLDRVVDAAPPESYLAYSFEQDVELWTKSQDAAARGWLVNQMKTWMANHAKLASEFESNWRLKEVEAHSIHLSELAAVGLKAISDPSSPEGQTSELEELFASASEPHGGTILTLVEPVKKLVESATKN